MLTVDLFSPVFNEVGEMTETFALESVVSPWSGNGRPVTTFRPLRSCTTKLMQL